MYLKKTVLAFAMIACSPAYSQQAESPRNPSNNEVTIPLNLTKPVELTATITFPNDKISLSELTDYFERNNFKYNDNLNFRQDSSSENLESMTISGTKESIFSSDQLNEHFREITRLAESLSANPTWTFKQIPSGS